MPEKNCRGSLYQDDGHSFAYQRGELFRVNYSCQASPASITITSVTEKNSFQPWWNTAEITVYGANTQPKELRLGDRSTHEWRYDAAGHSVVFNVPQRRTELDRTADVLSLVQRKNGNRLRRRADVDFFTAQFRACLPK